jgi:CheY-like chemotaxis protein/HPt (histidine-containing phosphotransfer) domain-containing protein
MSKVRGARVLLVEDNEINQQIAQELLESFGIDVVVAQDGEEALAWLKEESFDCVLMDVQMPVMDGITATREIRKNPRFADLPIIALTANVFVSEQNEFLAAGMNDHIGKPIDPDKLIATLAKWVQPSRLVKNLQRPNAVPNQDVLPDLPGVKVAESVRRIGGNVALYWSLLNMFRSNQKDVVEKIREALEANDMKGAERFAHTLKGTAGSLGVENLQQLAGILEKDIASGKLNDAALDQVERELTAFIANIDHALDSR